MWIAPPGPARGISTARPAAPATSGDYDPENATLPGPSLSQPGHGLPPDRVRAARALPARVLVKLILPGDGDEPTAAHQLNPVRGKAGGRGAGPSTHKGPRRRTPQGRPQFHRHWQEDRPSRGHECSRPPKQMTCRDAKRGRGTSLDRVRFSQRPSGHGDSTKPGPQPVPGSSAPRPQRSSGHSRSRIGQSQVTGEEGSCKQGPRGREVPDKKTYKATSQIPGTA
jgi:hypothetical protein